MTDAALVTGGAHGIGAATALRLSQRLAVVVADIDQDAATTVVAAIVRQGGDARAVRLDVSDSDSWRSLRERCDAEGWRIAVAVNNAYTITRSAAHDQDDETWARQLDVIVGGIHRCIRTFHDHLAIGGSMINVASVHALQGAALHSAYAAAKGAVVALTRQLAVEYGPTVRVNAVLPGAVETRAWDGLIDDDGRRALEQTIVARRFGTPEDVAASIAFLASDDASYITGECLVVDGGLTISA